MKGHYTLSSSIPADGHISFVVYDEEGESVGELHLKRPLPEIPSQYAGEIYFWDDEDVKATNEVKHSRPALKLPEWVWNRDERKLVEVKVIVPKPQAPSGVGGHLKEWREYFSKK